MVKTQIILVAALATAASAFSPMQTPSTVSFFVVNLIGYVRSYLLIQMDSIGFESNRPSIWYLLSVIPS
jgi:hypothetical protein